MPTQIKAGYEKSKATMS